MKETKTLKRTPFNVSRFQELAGQSLADFQFFPAIGSTNEEARNQLRVHTAPAPMLLLTDQQLAGRGRLGRSWQAPAFSSLLFTLVFPVRLPLTQAFLYSAALALSIRQATFQLAQVKLDLKWPNDLLRDGKKVAGLLAELENNVGSYKNQTWLALGCGLNVNVTQAEFEAAGLEAKATSILPLDLSSNQAALGREQLLAAIFTHWQAYQVRLEADPQTVRKEWTSHLLTIGKWVEVWVNNRVEASGIAIGVDTDGTLILREVTGLERRFPAADVSVRLPDGRYSA